MVKNPPANAGDIRHSSSRSLGQEGPPKEGMATHSSILAWKIPWTEEAGRLQSMGLRRAGHSWSDWALEPQTRTQHRSGAQWTSVVEWINACKVLDQYLAFRNTKQMNKKNLRNLVQSRMWCLENPGIHPVSCFPCYLLKIRLGPLEAGLILITCRWTEEAEESSEALRHGQILALQYDLGLDIYLGPPSKMRGQMT